jgi:hypothetical protein
MKKSKSVSFISLCLIHLLMLTRIGNALVHIP